MEGDGKMKILAVQLAGIGDSLLTIPAIKELSKKEGNQVDVLVMYKGAKDVLENQDLGCRGIFQFNMIREGAFKTVKFCLKLRKEKYDKIFLFCPQARIHYDVVANLIGAKEIIGFDYQNGFFHTLSKKILLSKVRNFDYNKHIILQNLSIVGGRLQKGIKLKIDEKLKTKTKKELKEIVGPKIGIHIGSGTTKNLFLKRWPIKNWKELIRLCVKQKYNVLLFGLDEQKDNLRLKREIDSENVFVMDKKDLNETISQINECDLFVGADSLLMHVASILNKPQIVIAGPALDKTIEPVGKNKLILSANLLCQPCYKYGKYINCTNKKKLKCVCEISPERVFKELNRFLTVSQLS